MESVKDSQEGDTFISLKGSFPQSEEGGTQKEKAWGERKIKKAMEKSRGNLKSPRQVIPSPRRGGGPSQSAQKKPKRKRGVQVQTQGMAFQTVPYLYNHKMNILLRRRKEKKKGGEA